MNSAVFSTQIRLNLENKEYFTIKYVIGCVLILGACITVLGLVATYTAWGLISAISDTNSHAILRSSMGQYVTSLPSKFVVAALYLFLIWLILFIADIISGPVKVILIVLVMAIFFQVVVSLSAFGRLIIHTGAMGKKRVLDPEFEKLLLPSGLHASLLIKATERRRRRTSVMTQYNRSKSKKGMTRSTSTPEYMMNNNNSSTNVYRRSSTISSRGSEQSFHSQQYQRSSELRQRTSETTLGSFAEQEHTGLRMTLQQVNTSSNYGSMLRESMSNGLSREEDMSILETAKAFGGKMSSGTPYSATHGNSAVKSKLHSPMPPKTQVSTPVFQQQHETIEGQSPINFPNSNSSAPRSTNKFRDSGRSSHASVSTVGDDSVDDLAAEIAFPRASILNQAGTNKNGELYQVLQKTLAYPSTSASSADDDSEHKNEEIFHEATNTIQLENTVVSPLANKDATTANLETISGGLPTGTGANQRSMENLAMRQSMAVYRQNSSRGSRRKMREEWKEEDDARDMYGEEPPVSFLEDSNQSHQYIEEDPKDDSDDDSARLPRASFLNRMRFASMTRFINRQQHNELQGEDSMSSMASIKDEDIQKSLLSSGIEEERSEEMRLLDL